MAILSSALDRIKQQLLENQILDDVDGICSQLHLRQRKRKLTACLTVQLLLLQVLAQASLACLVHIAKVRVTPQAVCKAQHRLPLQVLISLIERFCARAVSAEAELWHGLRVVMADAMHLCVRGCLWSERCKSSPGIRSPARNRLQLRHRKVGWKAAGGERLVRNTGTD